MRELLEQGFEVAVVKDATAAAGQDPEKRVLVAEARFADRGGV